MADGKPEVLTEELLERLLASASPEAYLAANDVDNRDLAAYLHDLLAEKDLTRADVIVSATTIQSLRRFKDDVEEVRAGLECGVVLADTNDIKAGDQLEVFEVEERERVL